MMDTVLFFHNLFANLVSQLTLLDLYENVSGLDNMEPVCQLDNMEPVRQFDYLEPVFPIGKYGTNIIINL